MRTTCRNGVDTGSCLARSRFKPGDAARGPVTVTCNGSSLACDSGGRRLSLQELDFRGRGPCRRCVALGPRLALCDEGPARPPSRRGPGPGEVGQERRSTPPAPAREEVRRRQGFHPPRTAPRHARGTPRPRDLRSRAPHLGRAEAAAGGPCARAAGGPRPRPPRLLLRGAALRREHRPRLHLARRHPRPPAIRRPGQLHWS